MAMVFENRNAERKTAKIGAEFTPEKNAARAADLQAKQQAEKMTTPRGRHLLRKQGVDPMMKKKLACGNFVVCMVACIGGIVL